MTLVTFATLTEALEDSPRCHDCGKVVARCENCGWSASDHETDTCQQGYSYSPDPNGGDLYTRGHGEDCDERWLCAECEPTDDPMCRCGRPTSACCCP